MEKLSVFTISSFETFSPSDRAELIKQAEKGDEEALGSLYTLFFDKIFRFIYYRVSHKETAEDLAEDVFVKAFTKLHSLSKPESFESWLYQIARNGVIDYYRQNKQSVDLTEVENTLEYQSNIIDTLNLESDQKVLLELVKQLPTEQQIVIKLKFLEELGNAEIAEMLHKSEGAIRVIQFRALAKLRELINLNDKNEQK